MYYSNTFQILLQASNYNNHHSMSTTTTTAQHHHLRYGRCVALLSQDFSDTRACGPTNFARFALWAWLAAAATENHASQNTVQRRKTVVLHTATATRVIRHFRAFRLLLHAFFFISRFKRPQMVGSL